MLVRRENEGHLLEAFATKLAPHGHGGREGGRRREDLEDAAVRRCFSRQVRFSQREGMRHPFHASEPSASHHPDGGSAEKRGNKNNGWNLDGARGAASMDESTATNLRSPGEESKHRNRRSKCVHGRKVEGKRMDEP